ncbi:hypothetical protein BGZ75_004694 [Mortierella antarctica]|nr:hypothetical protein BGZ75_004694 [Mortierella antarctica]
MDLLNIQSHFQESARRAAGSFLSPLTNAIGEQRRLVDSLAVVSKVRVEECKHMMVWSKSQDVLLKLNLLIRKISDYEIRFGTQYESFREKIKYLRTKDDSLCEMGRRQAELQQKIFEASKSRLRSAKAKLLQTELDAIQKESAPTETKLQHLKRQVIKGAYTEQLNAIIELGKKMQIIGEHGKQLLDHIDLPMSPGAISDGRKTEDILQSARLALENWDQLIMVNPESVVLHPPPARSLSDISVENVQTLAVSEAASDSDADSDSESDSGNEQEFVQAPSSPLKSKPSIALTTEKGISMPIEQLVKKPSVKPQTQVDATEETTEPNQDESVSEHEEQAEEAEEAEEAEAEEAEMESETQPKQETKEVMKPSTLQAPFGSTLAPKLTLTPSKSPVSSSGPSLPPRSSDWASEAAEALAKIQIKKVEELMKEDTSASEAETLRRLEELEIKQAMELSLALAEAHATAQPETSSDLKLTAEELRFVMGDVAPKRSTKIIKRKARAPETTDGDSAAVVMRPGSRPSRRERKADSSSEEKKPEVVIDTAMSASDATATESESEEDLETPKASKPTRVVRGPQASEPDGNRLSQQGPRPWVPEDELADSAAEVDVPEELASATDVGETMGEEPIVASLKKTDTSKITESMGPEPERPLESMGPEPEKPLESMGPEPEVTLESMGHDGPEEENVPFVPMPQVPSLDGIRQQKIIMKQQQKQQQQQQAAYGVSPELQFLQLQNSPQSANQQAYSQGHSQGQMQGQYSPQTPHGSLHAASPSQTYSQIGSPVPYRPATAYVPQTPKQKNRLSGSQTPDRQSTASPGSSPQPQYQQQQQQQHYQSGTYSAQYLQQHQQNEQQYIRQQRQQLQDFYYSPYEQEYQQQQYQQYQQQLREQRQQHQRLDSVSSVSSVGSNVGIAPLGWNLPGMAPPQITDEDRRYYTEQQQHHHDRPGSAAGSVHGDEPVSGAPSPSSSHISLVHAPSPVMASVAPLTPQGKQPPRKTSPHTASPDDYKVEVK